MLGRVEHSKTRQTKYGAHLIKVLTCHHHEKRHHILDALGCRNLGLLLCHAGVRAISSSASDLLNLAWLIET